MLRSVLRRKHLIMHFMSDSVNSSSTQVFCSLTQVFERRLFSRTKPAVNLCHITHSLFCWRTVSLCWSMGSGARTLQRAALLLESNRGMNATTHRSAPCQRKQPVSEQSMLEVISVPAHRHRWLRENVGRPEITDLHRVMEVISSFICPTVKLPLNLENLQRRS